MTVFNITPPLGRMGIGGLSLPIDTTGLPSNIKSVSWTGMLGLVTYFDRSGADTFFDPSPYESFVDQWLTAAETSFPALPLTQAQQIKADLTNAVYSAYTTVPIYFPVGAGNLTWYTTPDKVQQLNSILNAATASALASYSPTPGTPGTPVKIGSHQSTSGNQSSLSCTTTANILAGDLVLVIWALADSNGRTATGVSDGTNSYNQISNIVGTNNSFNANVAICPNAQAVASGATVTITLSGATGSNDGYFMSVIRIPGMNAAAIDQVAAPIDNTISAANAGISISGLQQTPDLAIGVACIDTTNTSKAFNTTSGWTQIDSFVSSSSHVQTSVQYKVLPNALPFAWDLTTVGASYGDEWLLQLATFKSAVASISLPNLSVLPFGQTSPASITASEASGLLNAITTRNAALEANRAALLASVAVAGSLPAVIAVKYKQGWPGHYWPGPASMALTPYAAVSGKFWPDPASLALTVN